LEKSQTQTPTQSIKTSTALDNIAKRRSERVKSSKINSKARGNEKGGATGMGMSRKPFESTRLKGEIYKPWLEKKDPAQRWARWITLVSIMLGFALAAFCKSNTYSLLACTY
jgi:hypothetical protein